MTNTVLLLDCGASRIKAALYDLTTNSFLAERDAPAPEPVFGKDGAVEIPATAHAAILQALLDGFASDLPQPQAAALASEMGGFILVDAADKPLTPYISWRDERAVLAGTVEKLNPHADSFRAITGMRLKAGLPFATLAYLAEQKAIPAGARLLSLPEWIITCCGASSRKTDETMAAASGLYDVVKKEWSTPLLALLPTLQLNHVVNGATTALGTLNMRGKPIPVYGGIGDLQAAMLGAGLQDDDTLCLNLGTGSQINRISATMPQGRAEYRPFLGRGMATLSHIPAGRALRVFERFYSALSGDASGAAFWSLLGTLSAQEIREAPLKVNLNVFATAWQWDGIGGSIGGITETNFTPPSLAASILRAFAEQYREAAEIIDPDHTAIKVKLAGGLARRIPALRELFTSLLQREVATPAEAEETLCGLAAMLAERMRQRGA